MAIFSKALTTAQPIATRLLSSAEERNQLACAYLFAGRAQSDKLSIARELTATLNCLERLPDGQSCYVGKNENLCVNCRWLKSDEHPQAWCVLSGEGKKSGKVPVEKARELSEELSKTSQYYRAVIVEDASEQYFHRPAANALLKTIEEPKGSIIFLFFALSVSDVLKTIVSRCQVIEFKSQGIINDGTYSLSQTNPEPPVAILSERLAPLVARFSRARGKETNMIALEIAQTLQELNEEEADLDEMIDYLAALELASLKQEIAQEELKTKYASDFLKLCDSAKQQSEHYVSAKAVIESFAFRWSALQEALKC
jgi:DNA polymerase-3 subunit delta'